GNDAVTDVPVGYQITLNPTASADPNYNNKTPLPVAFINDDTAPAVIFTLSLHDALPIYVNGQFTVFRTGDTTGSLVVNYTVGGTTGSAEVCTPVTFCVRMQSAQRSAVIPVTVIDDVVVEPLETVIVTLTPSVNYTVMSPS